MAEVGAAAAVLQLLRYGTELGFFAAALPGVIRDAPEKIGNWAGFSQAVLGLLDDIEDKFSSLDPNTAYLVRRCRGDLIKLRTIVRPMCSAGDVSRRQRLRNAAFVVRKELEIQQTMTSAKELFNLIALSVNTLHPGRPGPRHENLHNSTSSEPLSLICSNYSSGCSIIHHAAAMMTLFAPTPVPLRLLADTSYHSDLRAQLSTLDCATHVVLDATGERAALANPIRDRFLQHLCTSSDYPKYQALALRAINMHFPSSFAQPNCLRQGHELYPHSIAIIQRHLNGLPGGSTTEEVALVGLRCCMYLLAIGDYVSAAKLALKFQEWWANGPTVPFEIMTSFQAKAAAAESLRGEVRSALSLHQEIYRERHRQLGRSDSQTIHGLNNIAIAHQDMGHYKTAVHYHQKALTAKTLQLGPTDPDTILSFNNLGVTLLYQGQYKRSEDLFRKTLSAWSKIYEADDLFLLTARSNLGIALHSQGQYKEAEALHRFVITARQRTLGKTHHETMKSRANLAMTLNETGHYNQAEKLYREVLRTYQKKLGPSHPDTLKIHHNLATTLHDRGKYEEAASNITTALPHLRRMYGDAHAETLEALEFWATLLHCLEQYELALDVATEVYEMRRDHLGFEHDDTQRILRHVRDLAENCEEERTMADFPTFMPIAVA
ncbi:hypothetical protein FB567DRAFT_236200 [Paraphoma chrysanthemicola]|uniref:TPR-like protein n=1 Tax=Paraphoma chrysanthemicola TaxID=798071 RepID=A0A8K0RDX1_9PLEO|nr:hypothetical protein FB567DRAFT_236200 [Paraphoma chrysanthemicola]